MKQRQGKKCFLAENTGHGKNNVERLACGD